MEIGRRGSLLLSQPGLGPAMAEFINKLVETIKINNSR